MSGIMKFHDNTKIISAGKTGIFQIPAKVLGARNVTTDSINVQNLQYYTLHFTHSVIMAIFPGEPGLAGCPLILLLHLFLDCASFWDRPKLSMSCLIQSHQVFFGRPVCLIPSTSHVIQRLSQSLSSFRSTCWRADVNGVMPLPCSGVLVVKEKRWGPASNSCWLATGRASGHKNFASIPL